MLSFWEIDSNQAKKHFDMVKNGHDPDEKKMEFFRKIGSEMS